MKPYLFLFFLSICFGCGSIPTEPETETPQTTEPLLLFPPEFQGIKFVEVKPSSLIGTPLQRFYPDNLEVQQFEYEDHYLFGYLIRYESPIQARVQHDAAVDLIEGTAIDAGGYNPFYVLEGRRPYLFLYAGNAAAYLTLDPLNDNHETALAKARSFARLLLDLNQFNVFSEPYYVTVAFRQLEPKYGTVLTAGENLRFQGTLDYTLGIPDRGQIVFDIVQENPLVQKQIVMDVVKGMGTITFADSLRLSSTIPAEGTRVRVTATLLPPYVGTRLPSFSAGDIIERISEGQYRITARSQLTYQVR